MFEKLKYGVEYIPEIEAEGYTMRDGQKYILTDESKKTFYKDIYFDKQ